jgi:hypothetical protein
LVIILEETPPHPAQINAVTKKKDARTRFIGPFETYTQKCLLLDLDAPVLSCVAPKGKPPLDLQANSNDDLAKQITLKWVFRWMACSWIRDLA